MNDERDSQQEELRYNSNENANREENIFSLVYWQQLYAANPEGLIGCGAAVASILFQRSGLLSFLLWIAGVVFCILGLRKKPKWPSIVGLSLSLIGIFILIIVVGIFTWMLSLLFETVFDVYEALTAYKCLTMRGKTWLNVFSRAGCKSKERDSVERTFIHEAKMGCHRFICLVLYVFWRRESDFSAQSRPKYGGSTFTCFFRLFHFGSGLGIVKRYSHHTSGRYH